MKEVREDGLSYLPTGGGSELRKSKGVDVDERLSVPLVRDAGPACKPPRSFSAEGFARARAVYIVGVIERAG